MTDEVTAQQILQDWATSKGWSTTLTVDKKTLYFHYDKFNGFATLDFSKVPALTLIVSGIGGVGVRSAILRGMPGWGNPSGKQDYNTHELSLANPNVLKRIERILERTIDEYTEEL